jgi:hypothetical protein
VDAKGCTSLAAAAITIAEPVVVSATISVTTPLSCGAGNATQSATVTVGAGGNPYQYNFNNQGFTTSNTFVTNTAGPVSVIARDVNGCSFATAVVQSSIESTYGYDFFSTPIYCAPASVQQVRNCNRYRWRKHLLVYAILLQQCSGNTSEQVQSFTLVPGTCSK